MVQYAEECRTLGIPFIFDPGQQCARMSGDELRDGIDGARIVIVNDYELELLRRRPARRSDDPARGEALIVTRGEHGSSVLHATAASTCRPSRRTASSIRPASATRSAAA
jgi:adenosine kinase